jgi:pyruvate formate lyase activating enzyme
MGESGIVFDIKRGVTKDGPGLRTSVFLKGCPLRCAWCHNPESQSFEPERAITTGELCGRRMTVSEVMDEVRRDAVFYAASGGGLTITGGEPMAQPAFTAALAEKALAEGIGVAIDTSGFAPWSAFEKLLCETGGLETASPLTGSSQGGGGLQSAVSESSQWGGGLQSAVSGSSQWGGGLQSAVSGSSQWGGGLQSAVSESPHLTFLYDLKCMDPARHKALTGVDNAPILDNLRRLDSAGARIWIRCPLVPGLNDSNSDLTAIRDFVAQLHHVERLDILPYHALGLEKYAKFGKRPRPELPAPPTSNDIARWRRALPSPKPA